AAAAEDPSEEVAEVAEVEALAGREGEAARPAGAGEASAAVRCAERVVALSLLRVGEDVVGGLHLLEALLRARVARVLVRVVLARELAVRLLDLLRRSVLRDAERLVERGHAATPALIRPRPLGPDAGRSRRGGNPSAAPG